jgi:predicted Zn-dependent protease
MALAPLRGTSKYDAVGVRFISVITGRRFRLLQSKQPSYYSSVGGLGAAEKAFSSVGCVAIYRPNSEATAIPETHSGTTSPEAASSTAQSQRQSWRLWFVLAALVGVLIGIAIMYKPAPTPLDEAITLIRANKHAAALSILEELAKKQPDNEEVFPWLAQCYLRTDRLAEGRTALDTALKLKLPTSLTAPVVLSYAEYYENRDDYEEAERLFVSAQQDMSPKDLAHGKANLFMRWSESDANDGQTEDALDHLQQAYKLLPDGDAAKGTLPHKISEYYRQLAAVAETEQSNDDRAVSLLEESLKWCDEPATRMALGSIYLRTNRPQNAIENYKAVCDHDENNLEARHHLVDLYMQTNNLQGAQRALLELTEKERSVENFELLSDINLKLTNYAGSVRALEDAIVLKPKDVPLLTKLHETLVAWNTELLRANKQDEAMSVKGHAERVDDLLKSLQKNDDKTDATADKNGGFSGPGSPPVSLVASRIWLAKGSYTPEGEIRLKNISGKPVTDLALSMVFYDNTSRRKNGSITVNAASEGHPMQPGSIQSVYFSCPNIVKAEHQLAVIIWWRGRFLKELPVVKER